MELPIISEETVLTFIEDLKDFSDDSYNTVPMLLKMQAENKHLAKVLWLLHKGNQEGMTQSLYICEIISRQIAANKLSELFNEKEN